MSGTKNFKEDFSEIYSKYFSHLVGRMYGMVPDYEDRKDLVQDMFIKLWESPPKQSEILNVEAFLYRSTKNHFLNYLIRSKEYSKKKKTSKLGERGTGAFIGTPEDYIFEKELREWVLKTTENLAFQIKVSVREKFLNNASYSEISKEYGIYPSTPKRNIFKFRRDFVRTRLTKILS